jgi:hypothetical protein
MKSNDIQTLEFSRYVGWCRGRYEDARLVFGQVKPKIQFEKKQNKIKTWTNKNKKRKTKTKKKRKKFNQKMTKKNVRNHRHHHHPF